MIRDVAIACAHHEPACGQPARKGATQRQQSCVFVDLVLCINLHKPMTAQVSQPGWSVAARGGSYASDSMTDMQCPLLRLVSAWSCSGSGPEGEDATRWVGTMGLPMPAHARQVGVGPFLAGPQDMGVSAEGQQDSAHGLLKHEELLLVAEHADVILHLPCIPVLVSET